MKESGESETLADGPLFSLKLQRARMKWEQQRANDVQDEPPLQLPTVATARWANGSSSRGRKNFISFSTILHALGVASNYNYFFFFAVLRCLSRCYCNSAMAILARFCEQRLAWNIRPSCCASIYRDDYSPPCFVYINFRLEKKNIPCGKFEITWVGYGQPQMHIECREQDNCDRNIAATDHIIMSQHEKALKAM